MVPRALQQCYRLLCTDLGFGEFGGVCLEEIEGDAIKMSLQSGSPHEQDRQDHIGESCCEVHDLQSTKANEMNGVLSLGSAP